MTSKQAPSEYTVLVESFLSWEREEIGNLEDFIFSAKNFKCHSWFDKNKIQYNFSPITKKARIYVDKLVSLNSKIKEIQRNHPKNKSVVTLAI